MKKQGLLFFVLLLVTSITASGFQEPSTKEDTIPIKNDLKNTVDLIYTRAPANLTATSSGAIYSKDIIKMPVTSIRNVLTGRLAGVYTSQFSGQPGADGVSLSVRGGDPLVIIDGIPRTLTILDLEEVESVTVLKDALSAAMLGVRSSRGVLSIVTKKGLPGKPVISLTVQTAFQQPLKTIQPLRAYDYATLYNEALTNDGLPKVYTPADLQAYQTGSDPYGHPDVDWVNKIFKPSSQFNRYTLSFRGGNEVARYFVAVEHLDQTGIFRTSDENKYNTNNDFKSYVIRSNIDVTLDKKITMGLNLLGRILNSTQPGFSTESIILNSLLVTPSNAYPVFNPNGSLGGSQQYPGNIYGQAIRSGYRQNYKRDAFADFYLKRTLDELVPGLWIRGLLSFNATLSQTSNRSKAFATYKMNITGTDTSYQRFGADGTQANATGMDYQGKQSYVEFALGYDKHVGKHSVHALVLANKDNAVSDDQLPLTYQGISGRVAYDYNKKYVAEVTVGYNGSNRYPEGTRLRAFPAAGLAWNISEEPFLKKNTWLDALKLYGSFGKTGWDRAGYFVYNQYYFDGPGYTFGTSASGNTSMNEQVLANPNVDYEKGQKLNAGIDARLLKNRLSVKAEYYTSRFYDLLMQRGKNTAIIGNDYPEENIGINKITGLEFSAGWQASVNNFTYYINGNINAFKTKSVYQDEVYRPYEWMVRTGRPVGQIFGYIADGLFQTQAEINGSATIEGYTPQPGDIKYKDLNADGIINQFDQAPLSPNKPVIFYGLDAGISWRGFDMSLLVNGITNRYVTMTGLSEWEFQFNGFGQAYQQHLGRWTPAAGTAATYPRLSAGNNINNHVTSTYWMHSGNYFRLKFVELGYSLPEKLVGKIKLKTVRVFASATNLFTSAAYDRVDPEVSLGIYPIQRVFNTGINVQF